MLTSYLGTNLLKHKNCSGSKTAIWVSNYKIRYIFILFFAWMNYVSGFFYYGINYSNNFGYYRGLPCFFLFVVTYCFFLLFPIQITHSNCWNDMTFYLVFFSVPISMVTKWDSLSFHTESFGWFLSGLEGILNLEFCY